MEHDAEKGEEVVVNLLDVQIEDDIQIDESTVEYHNIEHKRTSYDQSVSEHQNQTSTGRYHRQNAVQGVNRLYMSFNGNFYENVQFTSIGENCSNLLSIDS